MTAHSSMRPEVIARRDAEFAAAQSAADVTALQRKWVAQDLAMERAASAEGQELARMREELQGAHARIARLERMLLSTDGKGLSESLCQSIGGTIGRAVSDVRRDIPRFMGVFAPGSVYQRNALVVRSGGLWICLAADGTTTAPGTSSDWQLCVKSNGKGLEG